MTFDGRGGGMLEPPGNVAPAGFSFMNPVPN